MMADPHICIEQRGATARADDRTLGRGGKFIRAHQGTSVHFMSAQSAVAAGKRARNRVRTAQFVARAVECLTVSP
jgi:hypothetical protein